MTPKQARNLAAYNLWMNAKIYEQCSVMTDADRKEDRGAFFKSIHGTLNHILLADKIWMGRFVNETFRVSGLDQELHRDFNVLRKDREETDVAIQNWIAALTEDSLAGVLRYTSMVDPAPRQYELWLALTHFFNHQTHHRGQITTLTSQSGWDIGVTDLIWMPVNINQ